MPPMIAYDFLFGGARNRPALTVSAVGYGNATRPEPPEEPLATAQPRSPAAFWGRMKRLMGWRAS